MTGGVREGTEHPPFMARFALAIEFICKRFEDRDSFLSDSDFLDAADRFTTDDIDAEGYWQRSQGTDRDMLQSALFDWYENGNAADRLLGPEAE